VKLAGGGGGGQLALEFDGLGTPDPAPARPTEHGRERALPDAGARHRIEHDIETNLFVDAGAGAGKTDRLVARLVQLCRTHDIRNVAAITFTEKAAAELRIRVRAELLRHGLVAAAASVEHAAIGTVHAFARRLLQEFPVAAGLPPAFTVMDEVSSDLAFDERWTSFLDELLLDDERSRLVALGEHDSIDVAGLRQVAVAFGDNWDLVEERVSLERPPVSVLDLDGLARLIEQFAADTAAPDNDGMAKRLAEAPAWIAALRRAAGGDQLQATGVLRELEAAGDKAARTGNKRYWRVSQGGERALDVARAQLETIGTRARALLAKLAGERRALIGAEIGAFTLASALARRQAGELEFHDLLVLARSLLVRNPDVRRVLHERYRAILLDEFQDTDPIQLQLAQLITSDPEVPLDPVVPSPPKPGRLFVVGDPKQSIYRFRRADIGQYLAARRALGTEVLTLSSNFRTAPAVLDWVNDVFATLMVADRDLQPEYVPLDAQRIVGPGERTVRIAGVASHDDAPTADELRHREATDVAAAARTAVAERWPVDDEAGTRPCRWGDIAILLPARTSLPILEDALTAAGVPYRAENSSLVFAADEVRSLLMTLRALDDPTDELALVTVLRSALYGCSDVDLYEWYQRGGRWSLSARRPDPIDDDPVGDAFGSLDALSALRATATPAQLLERIAEERRVFELALATPDARDTWRRVRYLIEQARAWSEAGGAGLRGFVAWATRQATEGRYVADVVLPETDHDAVRILTIHAAKGLEFPVVILSGMTTLPRPVRGVSVAWPPGTWDLRLPKGKAGEIYEAFRPIDEQMNHAERIRLLYVACTRARDHLVVSTHRTNRPDRAPESKTSAELLAEASALARSHQPFVASGRPLPPPAVQGTEFSWADPDEWRSERDRVVAAASRAGAIGASRLAPPVVLADPGTLKDPVDLDLPPWQRGRYGTAVGRAVHAVLQAIDLATGASIDRHAATQAAAEGVEGRARVVEALARSALCAPIVRAAAAGRPAWRELFLAATFGDTVLEGYLDLLVRTEDGLVVVDYKTDSAPSDEALERRTAHYRDQLAAYGVLVEAVLKERPVAGILVFCRARDGDSVVPAVEAQIPRWDDALNDVADRLRRGEPVGAAPSPVPTPFS
jgi:ATP-dependent helicase/nuclease subunit A